MSYSDSNPDNSVPLEDGNGIDASPVQPQPCFIWTCTSFAQTRLGLPFTILVQRTVSLHLRRHTIVPTLTIQLCYRPLTLLYFLYDRDLLEPVYHELSELLGMSFTPKVSPLHATR